MGRSSSFAYHKCCAANGNYLVLDGHNRLCIGTFNLDKRPLPIAGKNLESECISSEIIVAFNKIRVYTRIKEGIRTNEGYRLD